MVSNDRSVIQYGGGNGKLGVEFYTVNIQESLFYCKQSSW